MHDLYGEVLMPPAVCQEHLAGGVERIGGIEIQSAAWLRITSLADPSRADLLVDLDRGEAEAIALAQEIKADVLLVDEHWLAGMPAG